MLPPAVPTGISVVIPTHNRRRLLLATLDSLAAQTLPEDRFEVIVGIDGLDDGTADSLPNHPLSPGLRWTQLEHRGSGAARNAAARLARHDVIVFLDDDQQASPELLAVHLERQRERPLLVQGIYPTAPAYATGGIALLYDRTIRQSLDAMATGQAPFRLWGGNFSVPRETWAAVGGFDESFLRSQDTDFGLSVMKAGVPMVIEPRAVSLHLYQCRWDAFQRQMFEEGRSVVRLVEKHGLQADLPSASAGRLDVVLRTAWRRAPAAMDAVGRLAAVGLRTADRLPVTAAQIAAARVVRRFYRVGGMSVEARPR